MASLPATPLAQELMGGYLYAADSDDVGCPEAAALVATHDIEEEHGT